MNPTYVYLVECLTYGAWHPMKIGVSKNIQKRICQLRTMGISCPHLVGTFQFLSFREALCAERAILKNFPRYRGHMRSREIIWAQEDEIVAFMEDRFPFAEFIKVPERSLADLTLQ